MTELAKKRVQLIECPRDAMQGIAEFIPTASKIKYLNQLLQVGFHTLDFGSFVSPKAIPQLKDTAEVLRNLKLDETETKLLAIVANARGAVDATEFDEISYLGFPLSISETFQRNNTNASIEEALERLEVIRNICDTSNKELVVYISMAFGNPYSDPWDIAILEHFVDRVVEVGADIVSISDTVGVATKDQIFQIFSMLKEDFPKTPFGAHLHTTPSNWKENIQAAIDAGCHRFDSAMRGFGGCPYAQDDLVGNLATENLLSLVKENGFEPDLEEEAFSKAMDLALEVFPTH